MTSSQFGFCERWRRRIRGSGAKCDIAITIRLHAMKEVNKKKKIGIMIHHSPLFRVRGAVRSSLKLTAKPRQASTLIRLPRLMKYHSLVNLRIIFGDRLNEVFYILIEKDRTSWRL
jgi:hypothetical protein